MAGLHFARETIGSDLIMPGCDTVGAGCDVPTSCCETVKVGGWRGPESKTAGNRESTDWSEISCHSEGGIEEIQSETSVAVGAEFPMSVAVGDG